MRISGSWWRGGWIVGLMAIALAVGTVRGETVHVELDDAGQGVWWMPAGASEWVLPVTGGIRVAGDDAEMMKWVRANAPFSLSELPVLGGRYGETAKTVIVPWPEYAEIVVGDGDDLRLGVRFHLPTDRRDAAPTDIVLRDSPWDALAPARSFREWRENADDLGAIPAVLTLDEKVDANPNVERLYGAAHFYLWGPALFSRHDVDRRKWIAFAQQIESADDGSVLGELRSAMTQSEREAVHALATAEWPGDYLTLPVAGAIDRLLGVRTWLDQPADASRLDVIAAQREALFDAASDMLHEPATWGDGLSLPMVDAIHDAGVDRALLLLSDLYPDSPRPDVTARAETFGYLLGRYDSYHSVHDPDAPAGQTWDTAQFDEAAYVEGRVLNADGSGHGGFKGRGFHLSPAFAFPYVKQRVNRILAEMPETAWFIDCDATAEVFDDYNPAHPATRVDDVNQRRERLRWLADAHQLVVGSEGGSVLFSDVIAFGHGVHTPYIGHLDPAFRDPDSPSFLGRYWPPDAPELSFKSVPVPEAMITPYFDPAVRIPLYQAALGDQLVATHHWSYDSLKFTNVRETRALLEILYMVPPMYHVSRATWPERKDEIARQFAFWSPLHKRLAPAPLTKFETLSADRLLQRTTFATDAGDVTITANFADEPRAGIAPMSVEVVDVDATTSAWSAKAP